MGQSNDNYLEIEKALSNSRIHNSIDRELLRSLIINWDFIPKADLEKLIEQNRKKY